MKKNEIYETVITDYTHEGLGVGRAEGMALFVPGTAAGDRLFVKITKVLKNYAFAIPEKYIQKSSSRITPDCAAFSKCGGCAFRHITYQSELEFKSRLVKEAMHRIGGVEKDPQPILSGEPLFYRNKAQYPVGPCGTGFYSPRSHRIVDISGCMLTPAEFSAAAAAFSAFLKENGIPFYDETAAKGLVRHLFIRKGFATGEIQVCVVINGTVFPKEKQLVDLFKGVLGDNLKSVVINTNTRKTNVIMGNTCRTVYGSDFITDVICGVKVRLSPLSFYQVNHDMAQRLYTLAGTLADTAGKTVLDLYCGTGTIGLSLAKTAERIIGVEIVERAVCDARENAARGGIKNARFICADAAKAAAELKADGVSPDVVILDPPRKGCEKSLLYTVAEGFAPERIVYISCNPSTLARDVAVLRESGYSVSSYTPVDMFPRTAHVETVVLMSKKDK